MLTAVKDVRGSELKIPEIVVWLPCDVFCVGFSMGSIFRSTVFGGICGFLCCVIDLMYRTAYKHHRGGVM